MPDEFHGVQGLPESGVAETAEGGSQIQGEALVHGDGLLLPRELCRGRKGFQPDEEVRFSILGKGKIIRDPGLQMPFLCAGQNGLDRKVKDGSGLRGGDPGFGSRRDAGGRNGSRVLLCGIHKLASFRGEARSGCQRGTLSVGVWKSEKMKIEIENRL